MQTPTVGYKLRWKITYGAKDPSGPLDVYFLFSVLLSGERWSLGKSRILTPEAAVSVVFRSCCCCCEADGQLRLYEMEKGFIFHSTFKEP